MACLDEMKEVRTRQNEAYATFEICKQTKQKQKKTENAMTTEFFAGIESTTTTQQDAPKTTQNKNFRTTNN